MTGDIFLLKYVNEKIALMVWRLISRLFSMVYCGELGACAGTDNDDVKRKRAKAKPCNIQLDVCFLLRHQCPCFAEGSGEESC